MFGFRISKDALLNLPLEFCERCGAADAAAEWDVKRRGQAAMMRRDRENSGADAPGIAGIAK
jgi:hypothetical protein